MELPELIAVVRRRWWLIVVAPIVMAGILLWQSRERPYQVMLRASVILPGDTEIPGNSERPELMIMDDVPELVLSDVFAQGVVAAMPQTTLTAGDVHSSLSSSRYSRILEVHVTREEPKQATVIAQAVAQTLPDLINKYLVAPGATPATVNIIDQPGVPTRSRPNQELKYIVLLGAAVAIGVFLALVANQNDRRSGVPATKSPPAS